MRYRGGGRKVQSQANTQRVGLGEKILGVLYILLFGPRDGLLAYQRVGNQ